MKRFALASLLALACTRNPPPTRVVTVVAQYIPILYWIDPAQRAIGKLECDVMGQPVIYVHPHLDTERRAWVVVHERLHAEQTKAHGGCPAFQARMIADTIFRLEREGETYCGVYEAQRHLKVSPNPALPEIVQMLRFQYYAEYDSVRVVRALPCH